MQQCSVNVREQLVSRSGHRQTGGMSVCPPRWKHKHGREICYVLCRPAQQTHNLNQYLKHGKCEFFAVKTMSINLWQLRRTVDNANSFLSFKTKNSRKFKWIVNSNFTQVKYSEVTVRDTTSKQEWQDRYHFSASPSVSRPVNTSPLNDFAASVNSDTPGKTEKHH